MRILLISYYFPPYNSVGAVRPGKLAEYFHAQGHVVHVLTAKEQPFPEGCSLALPESQITYTGWWAVNAPVEFLMGGRDKVSKTGFGKNGDANTLKQRLGRWYKTVLHWPDGQVGWVRSAIQAGRKLLEQQKFDLIYASAPPFSGFRVAKALSGISGVPWVAEFRDMWTDNHDYQHPAWRKNIERKWEANLLATASAVVTVSPPLLAQLKKFKLPAWEIRNGFDPLDFAYLPDVAGFLMEGDSLNITFTGNLYPAHYDLAVFCEGLFCFRARGGRARVHVAGRNIEALLEQARQSGVDDMFSCHYAVARPVALAMQKTSDVLLTFLWDQGKQEGIYSTKLFEYAGCARPILAIGSSDSDVGTMLRTAGIGEACESAEMVSEKLWLWLETKQRQGTLATRSAVGFDFTRKTQFAKLESNLASFIATSVPD